MKKKTTSKPANKSAKKPAKKVKRTKSTPKAKKRLTKKTKRVIAIAKAAISNASEKLVGDADPKLVTQVAQIVKECTYGGPAPIGNSEAEDEAKKVIMLLRVPAN